MAEPLSLSERRGTALNHDPLLTTKLSIPPPRLDLVPRQRLLERLSEAVHHKLALISAPAGFGKTSLLAAWCASPLVARCLSPGSPSTSATTTPCASGLIYWRRWIARRLA